MVVYIRQSKLPSEVSINKYNAQVGAYLQGEEAVLYQSFSEIKELTSEDIVVDYIMETRALLKMMGLNVPVHDYPIELKEFYGRKIYAGILGEIVNIPDNWGKFIKPKAGSKVFTGRVVNGTHDLIGIGLPFDYPIWISEVVEFIAEWRCFVLDGRVLDVRPYTGDYHAQFDASVIDEAISCWKDAPIAYGLDIGVTRDGRTLVVEVNDGYALGNYGLSPLKSINQDIDGAIDELDFDLTNKIDIGKANDNYFGYIFSIGSLPEAIHNVEIEDKTKFGILTYAVNTMKSVMTDQVFNIKVETENGNYVGEASHVLVLLTNYFADKKIFEENKDGYANILILKDASIFSKLSVIPDLLKGDVVANDNIEYIKARNIKISSDSELESDVDGDKSDNLPVEIKVLAQRVEVFSKPKED